MSGFCLTINMQIMGIVAKRNFNSLQSTNREEINAISMIKLKLLILIKNI